MRCQPACFAVNCSQFKQTSVMETMTFSHRHCVLMWVPYNPDALIYTLVIKVELFCQKHNGHHKQLFTIFLTGSLLVVYCVCLLDS